MINNRKAFLTVEVLISMIIIFSAIVTISSAMKAVGVFYQKTKVYETIYITVNSIKNMIYSKDIDINNLSTTYNNIYNNSNYNGFIINISAKIIEQRKPPTVEGVGMIDSSLILYLLKFKIELDKKHVHKDYYIYLTRVVDTNEG